MIVCIEAVAMPWKRQGLRRVRDVDIFAYCREERPGEHGDGSVQSANHALHLVKIVTSRNIIEAEPPRTPDHEPVFLIEIQVFGVHRDTASYRVAYQKFAGCPLHIIEYMMDYYARIKRVVRKVNKETKLEREFRLKRRRNGAERPSRRRITSRCCWWRWIWWSPRSAPTIAIGRGRGIGSPPVR